ncbi:nucleotidyltransferase domain-containing protein [Psychrobacillus sp.]|uniref:nucleotidyltransferase domain-containing protein n=1 Tax=Psychrobacillus sp. TaxID=1871623 RepID=UPI0028BF388A|nr:nucleotidyltransferase domain-containing protein [Psychrobacillus sp.]
MILEDAVEAIVYSLKQDKKVQAIFLKGSMGRGEQDEHSDIDLYCLVNEEDKEDFLQCRLQHLKAYNNLLFYDDIFIVAPQILAVYENLVHVDLFTVTEHTYVEKDFLKVLYDPMDKLKKYLHTQNLQLSEEEFQDAVDDIVWFLFQYKKSSARGNDIWSVSMLHQVMSHLAKVLLHRYSPNRAQLGLKTIESSIPKEIVQDITYILEHITPSNHKYAAGLISKLLQKEAEWVFTKAINPQKIKPFWDRIVPSFYQSKRKE